MEAFALSSALVAKAIATVTFVILAAWIAERAGPLMAAMLATLPLAAAPTYIFISIEHDAQFVAATALASLAANAANAAFCVVHALVAQRRGVAWSLSAGLGAWAVMAASIHSFTWTLPAAVMLNVLTFVICLPIGNRLRRSAMLRPPRRWYDVPVRAGMVGALVTSVLGMSSHVGPAVTGILTLFPVVLISLVLVLQPRVGGSATGALTANGIAGLAGYGVALVVVRLAAIPFGPPAALAVALLVSLAWNLTILAYRQGRIRLEAAPLSRQTSNVRSPGTP
jgi:hypothetical protein